MYYILEFAVPDFKFDISTLYRRRFISNNDRTLSSYKLSAETEKGSGSYRNFRGTRGTKAFSKNESVYYETDVYYKILSIEYRSRVFEFGFSRKETIDNDRWVGNQNESWSLFTSSSLYDIPQKSIVININIAINKRNLFLKTLSSGIINTTLKGTFAFYVNGPQREIICFERRGNAIEKLYIFTDVDFSRQIYPTFRLCNIIHFNVRLNLKTGKDFKSILKQLYNFI